MDMTWRYEQDSGILSQNGADVGIGYSGAGPGRNNLSMQTVHKIGPIPIGSYTIGEPVDTNDHGPYVLQLQPDTDNEMFGRAGFLIHGDRKGQPPGNASQGCIILPRAIREQIGESGDNRLEVV
jgi:hypothetical protein